jgi:uncharacterized protein (TIGR00730 family)
LYPHRIETDPELSISSVCVYCGASDSAQPRYKQLARDVGTALAQRGMTIVYGGGHVGLMGIVADSALKAGAKVVGIIPEHIRAQEVQHTGLTELHVVPDMHTRKRMMVERSDAFIVLPGGLGTLDETFEILTWKKLKLHNKPVVIYNAFGYWDHLVQLIDRSLADGFETPSTLTHFKVVTSIDEMFAAMESDERPEVIPVTGRM